MKPPLSERERVRAILKEAVEDARHAYEFAPGHYTYRCYCAVREAYTEFAHRCDGLGDVDEVRNLKL